MPKSPPIRRVAVLVAAALCSLAPLGQAAAHHLPGWPAAGLIKFEALRDGAPLGVVMQRFRQDGERHEVDTQILFDFSLGPVSLYHYALRSRDVWQADRLVAADGVVNDDGDLFEVSVAGRGESLRVEGGEGTLQAPPLGAMPSTYWNTDLVRANTLIDLQFGRLRKIAMTAKGREPVEVEGRTVEATRYEMRGDLDLDIWYDARGEWVKMAFVVSGSEIVYRRVTPSPADGDRMLDRSIVPAMSGADVRRALEQLR